MFLSILEKSDIKISDKLSNKKYGKSKTRKKLPLLPLFETDMNLKSNKKKSVLFNENASLIIFNSLSDIEEGRKWEELMEYYLEFKIKIKGMNKNEIKELINNELMEINEY